MRKTPWSNGVPEDVAQRRSSGRRRYNCMRKALAADRYARIIAYAWKHGVTDRGAQTRLAEMFGCDRSTICRDLQFLGLTRG